MNKIFSYNSYKNYVNEWVLLQEKGGRGQYLAMANFLNVHTTMMSHVFKRDTHLSEELGIKLCEYLGLDESETDFFILLVQYERAGSQKLEHLLLSRIETKRKEFSQVEKRIKEAIVLNDDDKAIFYSSWHYSAIRLLVGLEESSTIEKIQEKVRLPRGKIQLILNFLTKTGILIEEDNYYKTGTSKTHINQKSPHIWKHHQNWRIKAMDKHQNLSEETELMFTAPLTIAKEDIPLVRERLLETIQEISKIVNLSKAEKLCCLNIDWIKL